VRIAFYAPMKPPTHPVPSGDRRMGRLLLAALRLGGHEVRLASRLRCYDGRGEPDRLARLLAAGGRAAARLVERWRDDPGRPELWFTYHVYHKSPDPLGPPVAAALGLPYAIAEAAHAPKRAEGPWAAGHRAAGEAIAAADLVFCLTRHDMACVAPLVRPPHRLEWLPPFLDARPYGRAGDRAAARAALAARHGLDAGRHWLLAVGMFRSGNKLASFRALAAALALLPGGDWQLLLAGDGPERAAVAAAMAALPADRVRFLGALAADILPALYAASDLYVWPAVGEAYGMALLEAQASGLPAVAGAERGVPDVVADGTGGVLVPPGDAAALAGAVRRLLDDPTRRGRLGEAARRFAVGERDLPAAARRLDAALQGLRR